MAQYPYPLRQLPSHLPMPQEPPGPPKFLTLLSTHTTLFVDPGADPPEPHPLWSLCVGFWHVKTIAVCFILFHEAVSSFGECGLPCGLRGSLCTLQLLRSASSFLSSYRLLLSCNTRYGRLVRPYPAGTPTPQEAPSFAWRTNDLAQRRFTVRWSDLLAICFESFMKNNLSLRNVLVE